MLNKTVFRKKYIKILKQKDDLLFHILLLMHVDEEGNYTIFEKDIHVIKEAMCLYVPKPPTENHDNSRRPED
jgi:hypothetical protein